ncbi:Ser/Thr protein phosphatase family protein [Aspergillus heteromorphus CBS 117.55]|uniref:Ser/Thr protein phosphatase family protein n=1 Tax=Aspergillus heteromorphus CBS 117.55 TaxID=1448321 RepID=A0A317VPN8_9EURO|nr:Ser/Thr protein phosphatase family protein [Aspergillus heteromorphus CBS 117.55]PWY76323.1 Ser/Thr protein phosphatase family protein [Aspergillus heteromorphus CBS 117.55]
MRPETRTTRFVCVSDTHAYTPSEAGFRLPAGDVLIHAGDLTNHGSAAELRKTMSWIAAADFEVKIVICGNHDVTLDPGFYAEYGAKFHGQLLEDPRQCIEIVTEASPSIIFLRHQSALVRLIRPNGPKTIFRVFGSPYSQSPGTWAYGYESADAVALWSSIPLDTDIVVTHTPPYSHCDSRVEGSPAGCEALRGALSEVRPSLAVCGHVHESRGYERVRWYPSPASSSTTTTTDTPEQQHHAIRGTLPPPGSRKQSLVDLTGKKAPKLDNDDFAVNDVQRSLDILARSSQNVMLIELPDGPPQRSQSSEADQPTSSALSSCLKGRQSDVEQNRPRSQRRETCIVNAAIMATSWPHRGGKRFHAPIVVDLELPVWREQ